MCNCNNAPASVCDQCSQGKSCCCPPDYSIMPQPVPCKCCPPGYAYIPPSVNFPNGYCSSGSSILEPVNCASCDETISSDCVILPAIPCLGLNAGYTLTQFAQYLCSAAFIETILSSIGLNPALGSGFCQLVQNCPPNKGSTTPIIGSITITYP